MSEKNKSAEFSLTRIYDAPVKLVWEAWTDLEHVARWWGPRGFTITTHGKDLRPGGYWKYTMHGPDGTDYPNHTLYFEVEKYKRLVYDHGGSEGVPPLFRVTATFEEIEAGKTKMSMTMLFHEPARAQEIIKHMKAARGTSTWDRLAEYLAQKTKDQNPFVIAREFDSPRETVQRLWSDSAQQPKWLSPEAAFQVDFVSVNPSRTLVTVTSNQASGDKTGLTDRWTVSLDKFEELLGSA